MKVYKATHFDNAGEGWCVSWHANRVEANRAIRAVKALPGSANHAVELVELPRGRPEWIAWLNKNLNRVNG